jgi:hypothetical protein
MALDDNRDSLPSASAVTRLMKCAASHRMTLKARAMRQEAEEHGGKNQQYREKGNAMHEAIYKQSAADLETDQDRMDYSKIMRRFRDFLGGWGAQDDDMIIREERFWLHQEIEPIFSGRPDYIRISPNRQRAAIVEFKSLWNKEDEPRENNQLWSQAVLLAEEDPGIKEFTLQIVSPHYTYTAHLATRDEVLDYEVGLRVMLTLTQVDTPPLTGDHCKHCGGMLICPAIAKEAAIKSEHPSELDLKNAPKLLERLERMAKYIEEVRNYYKLVIAKDPLAVPGWKIVEKQMRLLKSPMKIRDAIMPVIGEKAFWNAVSVSITKLESAIDGLDKGLFDGDNKNPKKLLEPFITVKTQEASLVKEKK